jgi:hypothetical protein
MHQLHRFTMFIECAAFGASSEIDAFVHVCMADGAKGRE